MVRRTAANLRHKPENGATVWAIAAIVIWGLLLIAIAAASGMFGEITRHDLTIAALAFSFVSMAAISTWLMRHDLHEYLSPARGQRRNLRG